jgi:hypothetical protein
VATTPNTTARTTSVAMFRLGQCFTDEQVSSRLVLKSDINKDGREKMCLIHRHFLYTDQACPQNLCQCSPTFSLIG